MLPFLLAALIGLSGPGLHNPTLAANTSKLAAPDSVRKYTGTDTLKAPAFDLQGHNPDNSDEKSTTPLPFLAKDDDGDWVGHISFAAPIDGTCGVITNEDTPAPSLKGAEFHGAWDLKKGERKNIAGPLAFAPEQPHRYFLYVICIPINTKDETDARANAVYSARYEITTGDVPTS